MPQLSIVSFFSDVDYSSRRGGSFTVPPIAFTIQQQKKRAMQQTTTTTTASSSTTLGQGNINVNTSVKTSTPDVECSPHVVCMTLDKSGSMSVSVSQEK